MSASEIQKTRVINELRGFIKKLLQDPGFSNSRWRSPGATWARAAKRT